MAYEAKLPEGVSLPPGFSINEADPRYVAVRDLATREGLSQKAFSAILGVEASRVNGEYERARAAAPTPAPSAPATKPALPANFDKLSMREQFAHALAHGSTRSHRGG